MTRPFPVPRATIVTFVAAGVLCGPGQVVSLAASAATASSTADGRARAPAAARVGDRSWHDFDRDGYVDLAIGAPYEDVAGQVDAGVVWVLFGSQAGLSGRSQLLYQDSPGVVDRAEAHDQFGFSVAAGDFDDDGYGDLAVGVPGEETGTVRDLGAVNILHGSADGLRGHADQELLEPFRCPMCPLHAPGTRFGQALVTFDWAYSTGAASRGAELAVGMPGYQGRGGVTLIGGGLLFRSETGGSTLAGSWGSPSAGARQGSALAAGDFDKDGDDELLVGAPNEDVAAGGGIVAADAGVVWLLEPRDTDSPDRVTALRPGHELPGTPEPGDHLGAALAAGDLDGDGHDDAAIGVPGEDVGDVRDAGSVVVLRAAGGGAGLLAGTITRLDRDRADMPGAPTAGDRLGQSVEIGDVGGPALADLVMGVPGDDLPGAQNAGSVIVRYSGRPTSATQRWHQDVAGIDGSPKADDGFGLALKAGDFDSDGVGDLVIGVPRDDIGRTTDVGAINVLMGTSIVGLTERRDRHLHQDSPDVVGVSEAGDRFGAVLG